MKFRVRCHILLGLVALLQFGCTWGKRPEKNQSLLLQTKVENLIEKILRVIQDYYHQIRTELKCIPDEIPDNIIDTLKKSIDCVDQNERSYDSGLITPNAHKKAFLKCFSDAKAEVEETITSIDPNLDYCPENMTEKTYQINVTTTFTKTFHINIKNGLEIIKKQVHLGNQEQICVFNQGDELPTNDSEAATNASATGEEPEDQNQGKEPSEQGHHSKEHHGKGHESKEHDDIDHESKEHHGKGHESKEHDDIDHESKEHHGKGDEPKEHHGKGHESKEHDGIDREPKEHHGKGDEPKEHHGKGHESKEHHGKGHESKEHYGIGHEPKEHFSIGHEPKEHHGKGHESETFPGIDAGSTITHDHDDHPNEGDYEQDPDHQVNDYDDEDNDVGGNESNPHENSPSKDLDDKGHGSKEDLEVEPDVGLTEAPDDDDDDDDNYNNDKDYDDDDLPDGHNYNDDSDHDINDNDYNGGGDLDFGNEPHLLQQGGKESQTEQDLLQAPPSKEHFDKGILSSPPQPDFYERPQTEDDNDGVSPAINEDVDDNDNGIYDDNVDDDDIEEDEYDDDDDDGHDFHEQNNLNTINTNVEHPVGTKNNTKEKNLSAAVGPIIDDDADDDDDSGIDDEKFFFPEQTTKTKTTTQPSTTMATQRPPAELDYYADPDTEPEDANYGNEYYDAPEEEKNLTQVHGLHAQDHLQGKLAQSKLTMNAKPRIQIKPRNKFKQKSKKQQNKERPKIKLPKTAPKKTQPPAAQQHRMVTSLSQKFSASDF